LFFYIMDRKSIKEWVKSERPREKMLERGKQALTDSELIAILLGSGSNDKTAVELAQEILSEAQNNLIELSKMSIGQLMRHKGVGEAKAISIVAALELGNRRRKSDSLAVPTIRSSRDAYEYIYPFISGLDHEEFWAMMLNNNNKVLRTERIGAGGTSSTTVDPKILFREAVETRGCTGLVICHNHPSDNKEASRADDSLTQKIKQAAQLLDIYLVDHIIVCNDTYYSYADQGKL